RVLLHVFVKMILIAHGVLSLRLLLRRRFRRRPAVEYTGSDRHAPTLRRLTRPLGSAARHVNCRGNAGCGPSPLRSELESARRTRAGEARMDHRATRRVACLGFAIAASCLGSPLSAHHSTAEYDASKVVEARGE